MTPELDVDTTEYQAIVITPSRSLLVLSGGETPRLPRIPVRKSGRPAREICVGLRERWGLAVLILEIFPLEKEMGRFALVEFFEARIPPGFVAIKAENLLATVQSRQLQVALEDVLADRVQPLARLGWFDGCITWVENATELRVSTRTTPEQFNGGHGFALICFRMQGGRCYWLKATGSPNEHEYDVTQCLSRICPECVPPLVATKKMWNAWLTEDAGVPSSESMSSEQFDQAVRCLAHLQERSLGGIDSLLRAGAFDHRLPILSPHIDPIIHYLIEAMGRQTSKKVAALTPERLLELGAILEQACNRMEALGIPDALLHNDLNYGNLLFDGKRCVIIDWSEAAVGNPFLSFDRLCALDAGNSRNGRAAYTDLWSRHLSRSTIAEACVLAPILAIYSHLYGRGTWLANAEANPRLNESYARSLTRHLDRVAQNPRLLEVLGRC